MTTDDKLETIGLEAGRVYSLTLAVTGATQVNTASNYAPVEVYSVSSTDSNAIVYDSNPVFATFSLLGTPATTLEV